MDPYIRDYENHHIQSQLISNMSEFNKVDQKNIQILHLNIRSISKNYDEFCIFLSQFVAGIDIIFLTETFSVSDLDVYKLDGYNILYNNSTHNKNDGVIGFIKKSFEYTYSITEIGDIKALEICLLYGESKKVLKVTAIYRSPDSCAHEFNLHLMNYLNKATKLDIHINIDILSDTIVAEEYKNIMNSYGYVSFINRCTRPQSKTCLDHFFYKNSVNQ